MPVRYTDRSSSASSRSRYLAVVGWLACVAATVAGSLYLASDERAAVMGAIRERVADRTVQLVTSIDGTGQ